MARQSPDRRNADDPDADLDLIDDDVAEDEDLMDQEADDEEGAAGERDPATEALWAELRIDPIEIALPTGTGYTLRAYRPPAEVTGPLVDREEDPDPFLRPAGQPYEGEDTVVFDELEPDDADDEEIVARAERDGRRRKRPADLDAADRADDPDADAEPDDEQDDEEPDDLDDTEQEEVPVFLGDGGRLYLFRSPESLVEFVRSGAANDLAQLDSWGDLVERVQATDVTPLAEDVYELDLVVENLRGGHDAWDADLIIGAGEIARDLGYALRFEPILSALAPGSPLDDLDEALRATVSGGLGGLFARRRLRKIGAQQATLGWRTIIGKISGVVDWRD